MNPPSRLLHAALVALTAVVLSWSWSVIGPRDPIPVKVTWLDLSTALVQAESHDGERPEAVRWTERAAGAWQAASMEGRVVDERGHPVRDAVVTITDGAGRRAETSVDVHGRFAVDTIAPGAAVLDVTSPSAGVASVRRDLAPDEHAVCDAVLSARGSLLGRVIDLRHGDVRPAPGVVLTLHTADGLLERIATDARGRFAWSAPTEAPIAVDMADDLAYVASVSDLGAVIPGTAPVVIALVDDTPAHVLGEVTMSGRAPLRPVTVIARHVVSGFTRRVESTGRFAVEGLPPGEIALDVEVFGKLVYQGGARDVAPGETVSLGELAVAPMGRLVIERDEALFDDTTTVELRGATGRRLGWQDLTPRERARELALAPGDYTLRVSSQAAPTWTQIVTVTPRAVTTSRLRLPDEDAG